MHRLFETHTLRREWDLDGLWHVQTPARAMDAWVPGCWENLPGLERYRGQAEYSRSITVPDDGFMRLVFEGVSHTAAVYLDDVCLGHHYGAYGQFAFCCRPGAGAHTLRLQVDNSFSDASVLHRPNDYMTYGGITRPCRMEGIAPVYIQRMRVLPVRKGENWRLDIQIVLENLDCRPRDISLRLQAGDAQTSLTARMPANAAETFSCAIPEFHGALWHPDAPKLYLLRAVLSLDGAAADDLIERFGLREAVWDAKGLRLNGRRLQLRGVNRHEDMAGFGCAVPVEAMARDLQLIKALGLNAIRTCHYPNDPRFLDLCDEMGLLVWEEGHARGLDEQGMRLPGFMPQSRLTLTEMITQHANHPAILIWGMLNECASDTPFGRACYQELFTLMRGLDASRPVVSASCRRGAQWHIPGDTRPGALPDLCHDLEDIICHNIYPGWYTDASTASVVDALWQAVQDCGGAGKPLIISEIGAGALYGYRDPAGSKWSEERQREILLEQVRALLAHPHVAGFFLWQFCDCRITPEGNQFRDRPRTMNNKGLVDEYRRPKLAYAALAEALGQGNQKKEEKHG